MQGRESLFSSGASGDEGASMEHSAEDIERLLRGCGFALTSQRRAIVRHLARRGGHWTAAALLGDLTREFRLASRATVYSTLSLLRDLGVLGEVAIPGGERCFDTNADPHHHFLCRRCGQLTDLPSDWLPVALPAELELPFRVEHFQVLARGICHDCEVAA